MGVHDERPLGRKGGTCVRITVIKLPKPLGRMVMAILAIFTGKKADTDSGDVA